MYKIASLFFLFSISLFGISACASVQNESVLLREQVLEKEEELEEGKFGASEFDRKKNKQQNEKAFEYSYEFIIDGLEPSDEKEDGLDFEQIEILEKEMIDLLRDNSQLEFLKDEQIESTVALERRASNDVANAIAVMEAFGFYSSSATFKIEESAKSYKVFLYLKPQEQYRVDTIEIEYSQGGKVPTGFLERKETVGFLFGKRVKSKVFEFPNALPNIEKGDKAIATNIIDAASKLAQPLRENGFPQAKVVSSAYSVNKKSHELNGTVSVNQGSPAFMGELIVAGNEKVSSEYLQNLRPWKYGEVWDDRKLLEYRDLLQRTGLFQNVDLRFDRDVYRAYRKKIRKNKRAKSTEPSEPAGLVEPVTLPILLTVEESTSRSFSGAVFYSTDKGPGVNASWEHRNFFGNGEKLRLRVPLSRDETLFSAELKKPAFIFPTQNLILKGAGGYEKTDAYEKDFIDFAAGLEREIRKDWWIESLFHVDKVIPKNDDELEYYSFRWVNTVRYDRRDNRQNPTKGYVGLVRFSPLVGYDESSFYSMAMEFDGSVYYPLTKNVLVAARLGLGVMPGSDWERIPRSKRFFLGGGGTVRGFSYQELGKHDSDGDPLGGLSYTLMNFEARIKITKEMSIVPFIDSGMIYDEVSPEWGQNLAWGTGIGLRYATPVGPVRFDVAIPLTGPNKSMEKKLSDFQIYISIGQAF